VELDHADLGQQATPVAAIAPIGPGELGHALEVLVDQLVHAAAQQRRDRIAGGAAIILAPLDIFGSAWSSSSETRLVGS
jgi:hypothetical protein